MEFHKRMDKLNKSKQREVVPLEDLEALNKNSPYTHPFLFKGSPFYKNATKESILEVKDDVKNLRPFDLDKLVELDEKLLNIGKFTS